MKKLESLSRFGLSPKEQTAFIGGMNKTGDGTASQPSTTFVAGQPECSDTEVSYDNDKGQITGKCTDYRCP